MKYNLLIVLLCCIFSDCFCQIEVEKQPKSFEVNFKSTSQVVKKELPFVDEQEILSLVQKEIGACPECRNDYYGKSQKYNLSVLEQGNFIENQEGRIYRVEIQSVNAKGLQLIFDQFYIPFGGYMHLYTPDKKYVYGAYTRLNNHPSNRFATRILPGNRIILEYFEPFYAQGKSKLHISEYVHVHKNLMAGFGDAGSCTINAACDDYFDLISQAVVRIAFEGNNGLHSFSSAALVNQNEDYITPYILTHGHGQSLVQPDHYYEDLIVYFNYRSESCENPDSEPIFGSSPPLQGAWVRSWAWSNIDDTRSDYMLYELVDIPENYFDVAYLGWDISDSNYDDVYNVSHPRGDIQKAAWSDNVRMIESLSQASEQCHGSTNNYRLFEVIWNDGTTDKNSSGSPLVNNEGKIVGTMHGGLSICPDSPEPNVCNQTDSNGPDWFSRLSHNWENPQNLGDPSPTWSTLKSYLDPDPFSNLEKLDFIDMPDPFPEDDGSSSGGGGGTSYDPWCYSYSIIDHFAINGNTNESFYEPACVTGPLVLNPFHKLDVDCHDGKEPKWRMPRFDNTWDCGDIPTWIDPSECKNGLVFPWRCECQFYNYKVRIQEVDPATRWGISPEYVGSFTKQANWDNWWYNVEFDEIWLSQQDLSDMGVQLQVGKMYQITLGNVHSRFGIYRYFEYGGRFAENVTSDLNENVSTGGVLTISNTNITKGRTFSSGSKVVVGDNVKVTAGKFVSNDAVSCSDGGLLDFRTRQYSVKSNLYHQPDIESKSIDSSLLKVYPNKSSNGTFKVSDSEKTICGIEVYDLSGNEIDANFIQVDDHLFEVKISNSDSGIYIIKVMSDGLVTTKRVLIGE